MTRTGTGGKRPGAGGADDTTVIAVTGTNGKTSTVEFVRQLVELTGQSGASWGTLGLRTAEGTDPDPPMGIGEWALPDFLDGLAATGIEVAAVEAFSSALASGLLDRLSPSVAVFTNLSRDHLDRHESLKAYFEAKCHLFESVLDPMGTAVISVDSPAGCRLEARCRRRGLRCLIVGRAEHCDVRVLNHETTPDHARLRVALAIDGRQSELSLQIGGAVMIENVLCAIGACLAIGIDPERLVAALPAIRPPEGRLERVATYQEGRVYIDYAHTPSALESLLESLRAATSGRLIVVFGCGGDRDVGKRERMGEIAAAHADTVIITDDNPRTEDPAAIRRAILRGCPGAIEVPDRRAAIRRGIEQVDPGKGDVVVVAGKGHEIVQEIGDTRLRFSDRDVVQEIVAVLRAAA